MTRKELEDRVKNLQRQVIGEHVVTLEHWSRHQIGMDYGCFHCERRRAEKAEEELTKLKQAIQAW